MPDDQKLYKYTANKDSGSTVDTVVLSSDGEKVAHLGELIWLTEEEAAGAAGSIVLEEASSDEEGAPPQSRRNAKEGDAKKPEDLPDSDEDPVVAAGEESAEENEGLDPETLQDGEVEYNTDGTPVVPDNQAGGVVDPNPGDGVTSGYAGSGPDSGSNVGQGTRGASGQDVGTTTGGVG